MDNIKETKQVYPVRKKHLKIQPLSNYVKVVQFHEGSAELISRIQALALEMCTGEYDLDTIIQICAESFRSPLDKAELEIRDIIERYIADIDFCDTTLNLPVKSNPIRILSKGKRTGIENPYRDDYPYTLTFSLTSGCNHRCRYCCNSSGKAANNELKPEEWIRLIDEAAELGVMGITFSGGEPSLIPSFNTIIQKTEEKGIYSTISTNGTNLTETSIKALEKTGARFVHLSLSAVNEEVYDNIEGCKGNFPKVINSLRNLKKSGFTIRVKAVIMSVNIEEIAPLIDLCYSEGVDALHLEPFRLTHISREGPELLPSANDLSLVINIVEEKQKQYGSSIKIYPPSAENLCWNDSKDVVKCGGIKSELTILPNGDVTFCEALANTQPEFSIGNVRENSLSELWYSAKPDTVLDLKQPKLEEPCISCANLNACKTGCFMCSLIYSDNPWSVDPRCWKSSEIKNNAFRMQ